MAFNNSIERDHPDPDLTARPYPLPANEDERLERLRKYQILDSDFELDYTDIVKLAGYICKAPMALISLVDEKRQWFKASLGIDVRETSRDVSFCAHAILGRDLFVVENAARDSRFSDNPLVTGGLGIRFYAGAPLVTSDNLPLGTICVIDQVPRKILPEEKEALQALSRQVMALLELRVAVRKSQENQDRLLLLATVLQEQASLLNLTSDAIVVCDMEHRITFWNDAAELLYGYKREAVLGRNNADLLNTVFPKPISELHDLLLKQKNWAGEVIQTCEDGRQINVSSRWALRMDQRGNPVSILKTNTDITREKLSEFNMRRAQEESEKANKAKGEFLANMSHEIRTPMNGIIGLTQLVLESDLQSQQREYLTLVRNSAESLLRIINDILDFSKIESGKLELEKIEFNLFSSLNEILRPLASQAEKKGIELAAQVSSDIPNQIIGDPARLNQILLNLIGNAIKFTEKGSVFLEITIHEDGCTGDLMAITFSVQDTGIGIPAEARDKIFQAFSQAEAATTRKFGGTGLGLSISKELVVLMDGQLSFTSESGKGSNFCFSLPFGRCPGALPLRCGLAAVAGKKTFIALPVCRTRDVMLKYFQEWGLISEFTDDPAEAVRRLRDAHFDFVFFDSGFAVPLVGEEWVGAFLLKRDTIRVVMLLSASRTLSDMEFCRNMGAHDTLSKPVLPSELIQVLKQSRRFPEMESRLAPVHACPGLKVLLAEDNHTNRTLAIGLLTKAECLVTVAENGLQAIEKTLEQKFDVILMDVQMPELDGLAATRTIRGNPINPNLVTPIYAMTAYAMESDRVNCLESGMSGFLSKPLRLKEFRALLDHHQASRQSEPLELEEESGSASLFDEEGLFSLVGASPELAGEVVQTFLSEADSLMSEFEKAMQQEDPKVILSAVHKIKGVVANFGAKPLQEILVGIKNSPGNAADRAEKLARFKRQFVHLRKELENRLNQWKK